MNWLDLEQSLTGEPIVPEWLIPGFLPKEYAVALVGAPGSGKSFLSINLAICLASGTPFLGRKTESCRVIYVNQENSLVDMKSYLRQNWIGLGRPSIDLLKANLFVSHFNLMGGNKPRFETVQRMALDLKPAIIMVDTLVSAFPPESINGENDNAEAARQLVNLRTAQTLADNKTTLWMLKHAKEGENVGHMMRGAKYWNGAADLVLFHVKSAGHPRSDGLSNTKLMPTKSRAHGLKSPLGIFPDWVEGQAGIAFRAVNNYSGE